MADNPHAAAPFAVTGLHGGGVLLVGEAMTLFTAHETGDLASAHSFDASVAGAELNVAVGLARLGQRPVYLTKLGTDPFGERIRRFMTGNGIDTSLAARDPGHVTGFMLKSKVRRGDPAIFYYRRNSAASTITPRETLTAIDWSSIGVLHLTGILPPLSQGTMETCDALVDEARRHGAFISFDPNLRKPLWRDDGQMRRTLLSLSARADLVLPGVGEGRELFGLSDVHEIGRAFVRNGARYAVVKDGPRGAYATDGTHQVSVPGFVVDHVVDTVGAGDFFAVGLLSPLLEGCSIAVAMERGCAVGAIQTQFVSDNEGLPTPGQLHHFINAHARSKGASNGNSHMA